MQTLQSKWRNYKYPKEDPKVPNNDSLGYQDLSCLRRQDYIDKVMFVNPKSRSNADINMFFYYNMQSFF